MSTPRALRTRPGKGTDLSTPPPASQKPSRPKAKRLNKNNVANAQAQVGVLEDETMRVDQEVRLNANNRDVGVPMPGVSQKPVKPAPGLFFFSLRRLF